MFAYLGRSKTTDNTQVLLVSFCRVGRVVKLRSCCNFILISGGKELFESLDSVEIMAI